MSDFLLADGFGNLSDGSHLVASDREILGKQWVSYTNNFAVSDMGDGRKWLMSNGSTVKLGIQSVDFAAQTTLSFCFRIFMDDRDLTNLFFLYDGTTYIYQIGIDASGRVIYGGWNNLYLQPSLTSSIVATSSILPLNTPIHCEVKIVLGNGTDGEVHFYINGVLDTSVTGIDTIRAGTSCTNIVVNAYDDAWGFPPNWKLSDIIVHNKATPIGGAGVYYVGSDTAGTDADFTPSAGSNENNVDEIGPDEDTTYNESDGTIGHRDSFTGDGVTGLNVLSVCAVVRARKTASGPAFLSVGVLHGGSEDQAAEVALTEEYETFVHFVDENPSTSAPWATAAVGAAEVTMEVG
jgi:hypothetical protein